MRLLKLNDNGELNVVEPVGNHIPEYAILSHTWGVGGEEVTFEDLIKGTGKDKPNHFAATADYSWARTTLPD